VLPCVAQQRFEYLRRHLLRPQTLTGALEHLLGRLAHLELEFQAGVLLVGLKLLTGAPADVQSSLAVDPDGGRSRLETLVVAQSLDGPRRGPCDAAVGGAEVDADVKGGLRHGAVSCGGV